MSAADNVKSLTRLLREGDGDFWRRLRHLLRERDIDPEEAALAVSHEDDERFEFGILVLSSGAAIQFGVSYTGTPIAKAVLSEFTTYEDSYAVGAFDREVAAAKSFLVAA